MTKVTCSQCMQTVEPDSEGFCPNCGFGLLSTGSLDRELLDKDTASGEDTASGVADVEPLAGPFEDEQADSELYILLEYKHLYLCAGKHGCLPIRLTNTGDRIIKKISLTVECSAFCNCKQLCIEREVNLGKNSSTETRHCDFDIHSIDGVYSVNVQGFCLDENNTPVAFRGSFSLLVRNPNADKPSVIIEDGGAATIDEIDIEAVKEVIVRDGGAGDFGHLVQSTGRMSSNWIEVRSEEDIEKTVVLREWLFSSKTKSIPIKPQQVQRTVSGKAFLSFKDSKNNIIIHIWTGNECKIGRNPEKSDLVCILLPDDDTNNKKNQLISKLHLRLKVNNNKVVVLEDQESRNGTFLEGQRLTSPIHLKSGQIFSMANVLSLRYYDFRKFDETKEVNRVLNNCRTIMDCSTALSSLDLEKIKEKAPIKSFLLKRLDNFQNKLEYLFILKSVILGSSKTATILVRHDSVSDHHARILLFNGQFYIEDLNSRNGTSVNGFLLKPYSPEPVGVKALVNLGDVEIKFRIPDL